jgi:CubicO group peptidase (beta-lactamase class C family)
MSRFVKLLAFVFPILFVSSNLYGQQTDDYSVKIDSLIQLTNPRSFNGVILITQNGKTKYSKAFGYSDFEKKIPLTLKDNFRIQSNSKQITAVLILREVEKGKIDLHIPIRKYLPDFKQTWADTVTVHHLLNNTSGIVDLDKPLAFRPGTNYYYSNPGYGLIRPIIEKVSGKTFIELANSLFKELKMHHSYCYEIDKPNVGLINGYMVSKNSISLLNFKDLEHTIETWANFIPAGGMISNVIDLNTWDKKLHHGKILAPETYKLMTSYEITAQHYSFGDEKIGYGYGLRIGDKTPVRYLGHSGKGIGFMSIKFYIPAKDVDVIVFQNHYDVDSNLHYYFESKIREIVLNSSLAK